MGDVIEPHHGNRPAGAVGLVAAQTAEDRRTPWGPVHEDLDIARRRSGGGKDRVGYSAALHRFEVASPFLKRFDEHQPGVRERVVQIGRSRTYPYVEDDARCESELAIVREDPGESAPHATRPMYLDPAGGKRGHRARPKTGSQGRKHPRHSTPRWGPD